MKTERPVKHPKPPLETPADLAAALDANPAARATFDAFPPSCKRDYLEWLDRGEARGDPRQAPRPGGRMDGRGQEAQLEI